MSKHDSTAAPAAGKTEKPNKPYPEFPLFAHAAGVWAKKIRGQMRYFGPWDDPDGALRKYLSEKDALHAGKKPREGSEGYTVKTLCNDFLNAKQALVDSGELTQRSWQNYKETCVLVLGTFGKSRMVADLDPDDFAALRKAMVDREWGAVTLGNCIRRVRVVFKFAFANGSIDRPVRYGQNFKSPQQRALRIDRAKKGPNLFTAEEVRALIDGALVGGDDGPEAVQPGKVMRAMVPLGINCGFGNADCGTRLVSLDGRRVPRDGRRRVHRRRAAILRGAPRGTPTASTPGGGTARRWGPRSSPDSTRSKRAS